MTIMKNSMGQKWKKKLLIKLKSLNIPKKQKETCKNIFFKNKLFSKLYKTA